MSPRCTVKPGQMKFLCRGLGGRGTSLLKRQPGKNQEFAGKARPSNNVIISSNVSNLHAKIFISKPFCLVNHAPSPNL